MRSRNAVILRYVINSELISCQARIHTLTVYTFTYVFFSVNSVKDVLLIMSTFLLIPKAKKVWRKSSCSIISVDNFR
jgi:hypothetical protein